MIEHTFVHHYKATQIWWRDVSNTTSAEEREFLRFIAYERWVNDKELLAPIDKVKEELRDTDNE